MKHNAIEIIWLKLFGGSHLLRIQRVKHLSNTQVEPNKSVGMINCQGEGCAWGDNIVEWCDIGLSSSCFGISPPNAHYIVQMLEVLSLSLKCKALQQNWTQEKRPIFLCPVFHGLSCSVFFSSDVQLLEPSIRSFVLANQEVVSGASTRHKTHHTTCKGTKTMPENDTFSCVPFCLRSQVRFEICG